jgi:Asp-tRNA(Asn)/Glu-tRNA(Gln) amidotransferase A subunit family amidase
LKPLHELSASEAARAIGAGRITSEALIHACLERITARDAQVQAWTYVDRAGALAAARRCDASPSRGPLHGVPFAAKDIMDTADMPTAYGSPIYAQHRPARDAACIALAKRAGGILLGKTVCSEFATFKPDKTRNPRDLGRTPGGSSSGSAAAVADGMVPLATATQTAGSAIRPAAYCGIVGYKPSFGFVPRSGTWASAESFDTISAYGRTLDDAALFAAALAGVPINALAATLPGEGLRVGLYRGAEWSHAEPATVALVEGAAATLARVGHQMTEIAPIAHADELASAQWTVLRYESARSLAHERATHPELLSPRLRAAVDEGLECSLQRYVAAQALAKSARSAMDAVFNDCDALITAATPGEAPLGLAASGDPILNRVWTMLHTPCITLPLFTGPSGMPIGLQVVGRRGADAQLFAACERIAAAFA